MPIPNQIELSAAAIPSTLNIMAEATATIDLEAAVAGQKVPRFSLRAYNGGTFNPHTNPPLKHALVVDLAGMERPTKSIPALKDHDPKMHVGHTDTVTVDARTLDMTGVISGASPSAVEVTAAARNGYAWPVSMGASLSKIELIPEGRTVQVNGQSAVGPVYVARASKLREISFLTIAADENAVASIAASAAETESNMDFNTWLAANGFEPADKLPEKQKIKLQATFKAEQTLAIDPAKVTPAAVKVAAGQKDDELVVDAKATGDVAELRTELAAMRREGQIRAKCGTNVELAAKAIDKKWSDEAIDLAIEASQLKAQLGRHVNINVGTGAKNVKPAAVIEAAVCMSAKLGDAEKQFDEATLEAAQSQFRHGIGLQDLLMEAAIANGFSGRARINAGNLRDVMLHAFGAVSMSAAGFSTLSLPGIFSNVANKFLLAGFTAVETAWKEIATLRSVSDFKAITSYRLNGDMKYEQVGPDGEIKHGTLSEESFTNKANTYAKMFAITRQDIINDDLGALTAIPQKLGRGAALKMNEVFWTEFMNNATFFASGNNNYITGSTTNLGVDGLTTLSKTFLDQVDADGNPLGIEPQILLVPNALFVLANTLMKATELRDTTANSKTMTANPFAGMYRVVRSAYLSNANITGNSTTAWYLLPNPNDLPVIEVALLNGRTEPIVETADADFNTLGIQMRGYHDFGVAKQDYRAAAKSKGAA